MSLTLSSISLVQFKNYTEQQFLFEEKIIGICGRNGVGKTNLLDAIHYLCFTKSYFTRNDILNVKEGNLGFRIEGNFILRNENEKLVCILRENGKKEVSLNDENYSRFSQHIGKYPLVIIAPDDVQLIIGGSEARRSFIDTLISQLDNDYLQHLIRYTKILVQRNSFLKNHTESFSKDFSVLDVLDEQLSKEGTEIFKKRRDFLFRFLPLVKQLYNDISHQYEDINLFYESEMHDVHLDALLAQNRPKDLMMQRTTGGIHKDELSLQYGKQSFKSIASQGQRKSLLFALKLAEVEIIKEEKGLPPILLLDDVFEKLDEERVTNLLQRVSSDEEIQIFITDTNCLRLKEKFDTLGKNIQLISLPQ